MKANTSGGELVANCTDLIREMESLRLWLDRQPDEREWSQEELAILDDVRHQAARLADEAGATIETFEGK